MSLIKLIIIFLFSYPALIVLEYFAEKLLKRIISKRRGARHG